MFFWPMAAKAPSPIEAIETKMMIWSHWPASSWKGPRKTRSSSAMAATLGAAAKKAVTGVGAPS